MRTLHLCLVVLVIVMIIMVYRAFRVSKEANQKVDGLSIFFPVIISLFITLGISIVLTFFSTEITIVYEKDGSWKNDGGRYLGWVSFHKDGIDISMPAKICGYSLYNASNKSIVMHPVIYGHPKTSAKERRTYTVQPNGYERVPSYPNYYFERVPDTISYRTKGASSGRVYWVVLEEGEEVQGQIHIDLNRQFEHFEPYVD